MLGWLPVTWIADPLHHCVVTSSSTRVFAGAAGEHSWPHTPVCNTDVQPTVAQQLLL